MSGDEPSAPWERPARWAGDESFSSADGGAVDDSDRRGGRRHRYADDADLEDTTVLRAADLIAALSAAPAPSPADDAPAGQPDEPQQAAPAGPSEPPEPPAGVDSPIATAAEPPHHDGPHRAPLRTGRALVAALAVVLMLVAGTEWVIKARADAVLAANQVSALDTNDTNISSTTTALPTAALTTAAGGPAASKSYQAENILLLGSDSRAAKADAALGGKNSDPGGSDVVMVAHLSANRSHVTIVSIPRDMYIAAPTCKAWNFKTGQILDTDYSSSYSEWRINSTYAAGGPACTVKAVQELTGLRIDRVIVIDFSGFAAMVNALGGIDVDACHPIVDGQLGTVLPSAGVQHIDGAQALNLVRARKVKGDTTSDIARIRRQQKVLSTILRETASAGVLLNPIKLNNVLQAFVHNVKADNVNLDNLLDIAQSLGNLDPRRVTFFTVPTTPDSNGVGLHATPGAALIWEALRNDTALPGEVTEPATPTPSSTPTTPMTTITPDPITSLVTQVVTSTPSAPQLLTVAPRDVNLQIVNVSGRGGVANQGRDAMQSVGFDIPSNAMLLLDGQDQPGITVRYSPAGRAAALTVAAAVPGASLVPTSGLGTKVQLMLGKSFSAAAFTALVKKVAAGQPLPPTLSTTPSPVLSTMTSTVVSTPPPTVVPVTPTTTAPPTPTGATLASSDVTSVNAGTASCI